MSKHLGDYDASAVIYGKFTTFRPSTGATFTLGGTPALSVYKDNSTTQSTSGVTLTVDFDSVTGFNHFAIDTSSDGTFYAAGSFFDVVITTGTIDGVSVTGSVVASFTIRKDSSLKPATAGRTLVVDASGLADATTVKLGPSGSGTAQTARDIGANVLLSSGTGTGQVSLSSGKVSIVPADIGAVWDVTLASHVTAGSTGFALNAASSAGDPWATSLPGAYSAGTAGFIVGTNLNATVSSRLASASYTAPDNADITAIKAKTDNLPAAPAAVSDIPTATQNADALLKRDWSSVSGEASFSALNAFRFLRNKVDATSGTSEIVYKEDGSTTAWSQSITTSATANPIVKVG